MKIISLSASFGGPACGTASTIKEHFYNNNKITDFFDSLVVSMKSINEVLEGKKIEFDNNIYLVNGCKNIHFKNFDYMISAHDIQKVEENIDASFNQQNIINEVQKKYQRRYERLIEDIKNNDEIYFLRYCTCNQDVKPNEILQFLNNLKKINKNIHPILILFTLNDEMNAPITLINNNKNVYFFFLNYFIDKKIIIEENNLPKDGAINEKYHILLKKLKVLYNIVNNLGVYNTINMNIIKKRIKTFIIEMLLKKRNKKRY
jgi:hypothetical protein